MSGVPGGMRKFGATLLAGGLVLQSVLMVPGAAAIGLADIGYESAADEPARESADVRAKAAAGAGGPEASPQA